MSKALAMIGVLRGQPKPIDTCPWSKRAKNQRLRELQQLEHMRPADEVLVHEDKVDIHLTPRIGPDWMMAGQQKQVLTPGQNQKRFLDGARDICTGELIGVERDRNNSLLFLWLLWALVQRYKQAKGIHVTLENDCIHKTKQVKLALAIKQGQRLRLHFLPPYCPDHNRIERTWRDLHTAVTRNHTGADRKHLMRNVRHNLKQRNKKLPTPQAA